MASTLPNFQSRRSLSSSWWKLQLIPDLKAQDESPYANFKIAPFLFHIFHIEKFPCHFLSTIIDSLFYSRIQLLHIINTSEWASSFFKFWYWHSRYFEIYKSAVRSIPSRLTWDSEHLRIDLSILQNFLSFKINFKIPLRISIWHILKLISHF